MSPHRPNKYCENALPVLKMVGDRREILSWLVGISVRASGYCVLARARWPVTWRIVGMACPGFGDRPCLELPHCGECWRMLWQSLPALRRQLVPRRGGRTGSAAAAVATCRATMPRGGGSCVRSRRGCGRAGLLTARASAGGAGGSGGCRGREYPRSRRGARRSRRARRSTHAGGRPGAPRIARAGAGSASGGGSGLARGSRRGDAGKAHKPCLST